MKKSLLILILILFPIVTWGVNYSWIWIDGICYNLVSNSKTGSTAEVCYVSFIWDYNDEGGYTGDVTIPETVEYNGITFTVTSIADNAFKNCHELTSVKILGGVKRIGKSAFGNCENLYSITIPSSVETIDEWAFGGCWSLGKVNITDLGAWCNVSFNDGFFSGHLLFLNGVEITDLVIPNGVDSIQPYVFANCTNINSISIPNSVVSIGDFAFSNCYDVFDVELSGSIKTIGRYAFANCSNIGELILPNGVSKICKGAFAGCHKISSLTISSSVSTIEEGAFSNCSSLASIHVDAGNTIYDSRDNSNAVIEKESNRLILGCLATIIPQSVNSIGNNSFSGCKNLSNIEIPSNVERIGDYAFQYCSSLVHVVIPNNTIEIGHGAFSNCIGLESIELPESVTSIGEYVFSNCNSLIEMKLPKNISVIPSGCLRNCEKLTTIYLGPNVSEIHYNAFSNCQELMDIYCYAEDVPSTNTYAFEGSYIEYTTLHVPYGSVSMYKNTNPWNYFKSILTIDGTQKTFKITYKIDGEEYKTFEVKEGEDITPEPAPTKDGYTFSGWSEIPETMPAHDVIITGSFIPNNYTLTYIIDNEEYKTTTIAYDTTIIPETEPTKEGYTFSGWKGLPTTMPAHDVIVIGTFTINTYKLIYQVDGLEYKSYNVEYGASITPETEPVKEGFTFSGWSEIPATMPAHDVVVTGAFLYTLTYIVDGEIYKTYFVAGGTPITPEPSPTKEGYTFSGWSYMPPTMPASDVVVMGTFKINTYTLTYMVDGEKYKSYDIEYNAIITPEPEPTKAGYTFSGWSEIPETMPAHDVTVTGSFTKDILGKCATPTISYVNGEVTFNSETEGVTFIYDTDIEDEDIIGGIGNKIQFSVTYHISVYAQKEDYYDSDVATATLCWIDVEPAAEGITDEDAVTEVKALPVLIQTQGGTVTIQGAAEGTPIAIYDVSGKQYGSALSEKDRTTISTSLQPGTIAIVKIGEKSVKVAIK